MHNHMQRGKEGIHAVLHGFIKTILQDPLNDYKSVLQNPGCRNAPMVIRIYQ